MISFSDYSSSARSPITIAAIAALSSSSGVPESQRLERGRGQDLFQDCAVERRREPHVTGFAEDRVHLEQREEEILHQCAEMRDQPLAGFREVGERRRVGDDFIPGAPIVAVALNHDALAGTTGTYTRRGLMILALRAIEDDLMSLNTRSPSQKLAPLRYNDP